MFASSWLRQLQFRCFGRPSRNSRARAAAVGRRLRPTLEVLEDRTLLSGGPPGSGLELTASNASDLVNDINTANASGGQNVIITLQGNIDLSSVNNTTNGANGLPVIAAGDQLTIYGNGYTIERSTGTPAFRLFDVAAGASLDLENLTLQGGLAQGFGGAAEGGAVYSSGVLTLNNVTVTGNQAQGRHGLYPSSSTRYDSLDGAGAAGGGLYVAAGSVKLTNDTLSGNQAQGGSGGTASAGGAGTGGGLYAAASSVTLSNDTLSGNQAQGGNGGKTTRAFLSGGGGGSGAGGGLYAAAGNVTLSNDTFSGNHAQGGNGANGANGTTQGGSSGGGGGGGSSGEGGGLLAGGASVMMINDTLSGNYAQGGNGGNGGNGGGFEATHTYPGGNGGNGGSGTGGGLYVTEGSVTLANTLLAVNQVTPGAGGSGGSVGGRSGSGGSAIDPDVSGTVTSSDHDLIGDGSGSNLSNGNNGDQVGTAANPINPQLGPLQNNGGPTQTMALSAGSPALRAGDPAAAGLPATDQRGYSRIANSGVDIGAFEYGASPASTDLSVSGSATSLVAAGGQITYILTVTNNNLNAQSNVTLTDSLPANTTLVSWTVPPGWDRSAPAQGSGSGTVAAWNGSLSAGASATFTLVIQVNSGTPAGTVVRNTASVGPVTGDYNPANNSVTLSTTTTSNPISDSGFESPALAAGSYQYNPTGSPWTFSGNSGIESNGSAWGAANAPDGTQAAFLQINPNQVSSAGTGVPGQISQTVTLNPGTYQISFWAAQRAGYAANPIQVQVDGHNVGGPISPTSTSWALYQTVTFTITSAGPHTIAFISAAPNSGQYDSFIDAVTISLSPISDFSFESPALAAGSYQYDPTGSPWAFTGNAGIESNGSAWGAAYAPDGAQAAFLQTGTTGVPGQISQTVTLNPGTYQISFWAAQRAGYAANPIQVQADGHNVGGPISPTSTSWAQYQTVTFTITSAGPHTITFVSTDPNSGDYDSFIDAVSLAETAPVPVQVNLSSSYNKVGIVADGSTFSGGLDNKGYALSANLLGSSVSWNNQTYALGTAGSNNVVQASGQTIALPQGDYSTLSFLATGVNGNQPNQTFTVTYTDGTTQTFTQSISDWYTPQGYSGESIAATMSYRDTSSGGKDWGTYNVYGYSFALDPSKTVQSITLPNDGNVDVLAIDLS